MIKEDVPVTTTNNGDVGLNDPKLPMTIFKRYKKLANVIKKSNLKN